MLNWILDFAHPIGIIGVMGAGGLLHAVIALALALTLIGAPDEAPRPAPTAPRLAIAPAAVAFTPGPGEGAVLTRTETRRAIRIPVAWNLRRKRHLKLSMTSAVSCEPSGWRTHQVGGRRSYVRVILTCSAPSDARIRRVALINRLQPVHRKTFALSLIIGHRGAPDLYPEESVEGYDYVAGLGIPLEVDLRPLADGTLVPLHDPTLDRTTTGTGSVSAITVEEWRSLHIEPAIGGTTRGHTLTWDDIVERYGGRHVIVAEVKTTAIAQQLADSIIAHGLQQTVIVQTWSRPTVRRLVAQGIRSLFLTTGKPAPAWVAGSGAEFIGVNIALPDLVGYMGDLTAAGVAPIVWTPESARDARRVLKAGAAGVFSNDPAALVLP